MIRFVLFIIYRMSILKVVFTILFSCYVGIVFSQEDAIYNAIKKKKHIEKDVAGENVLSDALNNNPVMIDSKEKNSLLNMFLADFSIAVSYGITEFKGDIKAEGFLNRDNLNTAYDIRLSRRINNIFSVTSGALFGSLNGSRQKETYVLSQTQSTDPYDPYSFYENNGEKFLSSFFELDLTVNVNIESLLQYYYVSYSDNNRISIFYNIGFGVLSFNSMKRNIDTETYIYGYGYHDIMPFGFEDKKSFLKQPLSRMWIYGYQINYSITNNLECKLLFEGRLSDTDFLDSSLMNQQNDKFRYISLGLDYIF